MLKIALPSLALVAGCVTLEPSSPGEELPSSPEAPVESSVEDSVEIEVGQCEGYPYRSADTGSEPSVWGEADEGRIVVHLDDMSANCCPSPEASFTLDGTAALLDFVDVSASSSCDCSCITDFVVRSEPLPAAAYSVEVVYNGEGWGTLDVVIP